jgi:hypothetical protein
MTKKIFLNFWLLLAINAAYAQEALIVHKTDRTSTKTVLDDIQRITFSGNDMSVKPFDGNATDYTLGNISKITFGDIEITDVVTPPPAIGLDVIVYVTPAGEIVVESPVAIQSLALFNIDGKILRVAKIETQCVASLPASDLPTGIYILQIKTQQGIVTKKIIKK